MTAMERTPFINYAHRGASAYAPENTLAAFYLGWQMGANGIETDVQQTRDGVLVLFHDDTLRRVVGRPEAVRDLTYAELLTLNFGAPMGERYQGERIPTLEEFLRHFGGKGLHFAIEIKQLGVEEGTLRLIDRYITRDRVIVTSGIWQALVNTRSLDADIRLGFLAKELNDELLINARRDGVFQICPKADSLTPAWNDRLRAEGFSVRAWGIDSETTMRRMLDLRVDGMTINFPDVLSRAMLRT